MTEALRHPPADGTLRLEPLAEAHRAALAAACAEDADIWAIYSLSYDPAHFDASFTALLANPRYVAFAILSDDRLVGMTAYLAPDRARGVVEIGMSYIVPSLRGTGFNGRLKRLMIGHAFACGYRRIEFRIDVRNARSQAAVAKLGALREGVMRQDRVTWTGHVRDTALFAILKDEWRLA
ncbi:GNAT family N-acetyltransferase [Sphingomonas flavalba]|uniref:GNAT family N-acetyltransferase n=1 Tax=Sphingomonas flavalba TaxID=2559804 RepID=UPI0019CF53C2|nr:GNAT family protein [Sphingomonas flavalba]